MEDYLPKSICRSCLQRSDELTSLHSKDGDTGLTLLEKLRFCASMQVPVSERTPSNACASCVRCITEYYNFKRRCEQSEKTLEELYAQPSDDIVPKHETFLEVEEERVTKTEPDDSNSSCDDVSDLTPSLEEVDSVTIARDVKGRSGVSFKCKICKKLFRTKHDLQKHVRRHLVRKRQCDGCKEVFDSLPDMLEHRASAHPDLDPYVVEGKNLTPGQLDDNKAVYKYQCDVCSCTFPTNRHLNRHKTRSHSERQHVCVKCGISYTQPYLLRLHMETHVLGSKYICPECGKAFRAGRTLREHMIESHRAEKPVYECKECGKTYNFRSSLSSHRQKHKVQQQTLRASEAGPITRCDGCEEVFNSLPEMLEHRSNAHPDLNPYLVKDKMLTPGQINDPKEMQEYSCDECSRSFTTVKYLKSHKTLVHSNRQHRCDQCGILFVRDFHLHRHLQRVHAPGGKNKFICETCGKEYSYEDSLRVHIEEKHAAEKPTYTCKVCGKTYNCKGSLNSHKLTHESLKDRFRCDRCNGAFPSRTRLVRHIKQTHDKRYSCDMCDKRFGIEADLLKHKVYHAIEMAKPYACTLCEKRFSTKSAVSFHVSTLHHGKKHLKCDICSMEFYNRFHYASHCNMHKGIKPHKCDTCGKDYSFKPSYLKHRKKCPPQQAEGQREEIEVTSTSASKIISDLPVVNDL